MNDHERKENSSTETFNSSMKRNANTANLVKKNNSRKKKNYGMGLVEWKSQRIIVCARQMGSYLFKARRIKFKHRQSRGLTSASINNAFVAKDCQYSIEHVKHYVEDKPGGWGREPVITRLLFSTQPDSTLIVFKQIHLF